MCRSRISGTGRCAAVELHSVHLKIEQEKSFWRNSQKNFDNVLTKTERTGSRQPIFLAVPQKYFLSNFDLDSV